MTAFQMHSRTGQEIHISDTELGGLRKFLNWLEPQDYESLVLEHKDAGGAPVLIATVDSPIHGEASFRIGGGFTHLPEYPG